MTHRQQRPKKSKKKPMHVSSENHHTATRSDHLTQKHQQSIDAMPTKHFLILCHRVELYECKLCCTPIRN